MNFQIFLTALIYPRFLFDSSWCETERFCSSLFHDLQKIFLVFQLPLPLMVSLALSRLSQVISWSIGLKKLVYQQWEWRCYWYCEHFWRSFQELHIKLLSGLSPFFYSDLSVDFHIRFVSNEQLNNILWFLVIEFIHPSLDILKDWDL